MAAKETVVLAYSGGLDTSCILVWLIQKGYDVVPVLANVGQDEDFEAARAKALKLGAKKVVVKDVRRQLVEEFVWTAVQGGLIYEDKYLLGTALARPCIVRAIIEVADEVNAKFISHGATGKGNDQIRFELGVYMLRPSIKIIAPWKIVEFYEQFEGRTSLFEFAKKHHIPLPVSPKQPWSIDENLIHSSYEGGSLEKPGSRPPPGLFKVTNDPEKSPDQPSFITITFHKGRPCGLVQLESLETRTEEEEQKDKQERQKEELIDPLDIMTAVNSLGALHGIGTVDMIENRYIGMKARSLYETPGLTILREAHMDLESLCLDREVKRIKSYLSFKMADQVYCGFWFSPEFEFTRKCIEESQANVCGSVDLKLYKGRAYVLSRRSPKSLYNEDLTSMDVQGDYEPSDAHGFIKVNAVRLREHHRISQLGSTGPAP